MAQKGICNETGVNGDVDLPLIGRSQFELTFSKPNE